MTGEMFIGIIVLAVIAAVLSRIFANPFKYPHYVHEFDFSRKRNPDLDIYVDAHIADDANWTSMRKHHFRTVGAWRAQCEETARSSLFAKLRMRQFEKACRAADSEFMFYGVRHRTGYRQVNHVKYAHDVRIMEGGIGFSWDEIEQRHADPNRIKTGMKEFEKQQRALMTADLRKKVMIRDHYTCQCCGKYMPDEVGLHIDHIKPVSRGGRSIESNLQVLCSKCNGSKSNK